MIEVARFGDYSSHCVDVIIIFLIGFNILAVIFGSMPLMRSQYGEWLDLVAKISICVFAVEYLLRAWTCVDHPSGSYRKPISGRLRYLVSPLMILDVFVIAQYYFLPGLPDLRIFRIFRLLAMLRLTHYSDVLQLLSTIIKRENKTLAAIFLVIVSLLLLVSYLIYLIERHAQADVFASIPDAMWWSISTLTTVGYGDVVPSTPMGKVFGMVVMLIGIGMFAIPTGILVSAFSQELKRKDFIVTWNLVAKVPLFSNLDAIEIASITDLLRLRSVMPNEVIIRKGEIADRMYFIVAGEVDVELGNPTILREGDFFGELGILYKIRRTANVTARTFVELLQLENRDFEVLLETNPKLGKRITRLATKRRKSMANTNNPKI